MLSDRVRTWPFRLFSFHRIKKKIYITEIFMKKKQNKSSITKNHEITKNDIFDNVPVKGYKAS